MTEFACSKCRYYGEGCWSQCGACELREQLARLEKFKSLCYSLLLALGPMGDHELVCAVAQQARNYHRKYWGPVELYACEEALDALRDRLRETDL